MARSIWNGTIAFGMVSIPVKLYSATEQRSIGFRELHAADAAPIQHRRFDPETGEEVPYEKVLRGFEVEEGRWVVLTKEELKAAEGEAGKTVQIAEFVPGDQIDPVFYDRTYYLAPRDGGRKPYRLLIAALERSGRVGLGRFTLRSREHLAAIRPVEGALALNTMVFHDELVSGNELDIPKPKKAPTKREVQMATTLVDQLAESWEPDRYEDTYRAAVMELIERKAAGEEVELPEPVAPKETPDLIGALEASLEAARKGGRAPAKRRGGAAKATKGKKAKTSSNSKAKGKPKSGSKAKTAPKAKAKASANGKGRS